MSILTLTGQNIINSPEIIKKNKIATLEIINCLSDGFCIYNYYAFNEFGQIKSNYPGIIAIHFKYEYDDNNNLSRYYVMNNTSKPDSINSRIDYYYSKNGKFKFSVNYFYKYDSDTIIAKDTNFIYQSPDFLNPENPKYNSKGQIIEHDYGPIYYPCGIIYEGEHTIKYEYKNNGLIDEANIQDYNGNLIVSLKYKYKTR